MSGRGRQIRDFLFLARSRVLEEEKESIYRLLNQLSEHFSKELSEFISLMSAVVELLRQLTSVEDEITTVIMPRTVCMSIAELADALKWKKTKTAKDVYAADHPLLSIQSQINVSNPLVGSVYHGAI